MEEKCFFELNTNKEKLLLENNFNIIKNEIYSMNQEFLNKWHEEKINNGLWYMFPINLLHIYNPLAEIIIPETVKLLKIINPVQSSISVLKPGAIILPHTDILNYDGEEDILISKDTYRMQLGIKIPKGDCKIAVKNQNTNEYEWNNWKEGKITCINDSLEHKAHNNTKEDRIVIIVDVVKENRIITEKQKKNILNHFSKLYPDLLGDLKK